MGKTRAHRETNLTQMSADRTWETSDESGSGKRARRWGKEPSEVRDKLEVLAGCEGV